MHTRFTQRFGVPYPIMQAPMAYVAGPRLVAAVANAGGLGMLGTGSRMTPAQFLDAASQARALTDRPFGVGLMVWALESQRDLFAAVLDARPAAVLLSFGDPAPYAQAVKDSGARLICQVQNVAGAVRAREVGADLIVAQGTEAGGHTGHVSTFALLPQVLDAAGSIPVLAAGGIGDGRGLAAALAMGADGVSVGTRFVATAESEARPEAKARIVKARGEDTVLTRVFDIAQGLAWPETYPGRALKNRFTERWHGREGELAERRDEAQAQLEAARAAGDYETYYVYAGQVSGMITDVPKAGHVVRSMAEEARRQLRTRVLMCLGG